MEHTTSHHKEDAAPKLNYNFFQSKIFKWIIIGVAELILLIGAFGLGMKVAFHKARFTDSWMRNYRQNFMKPMRGMPMRPNEHFFSAHGVFGSILTVEKDSLTVKDEEDNEKTVLITPSTSIRLNLEDLKIEDLKSGQVVVVIGAPNDQGQIEAKFIRELSQ